MGPRLCSSNKVGEFWSIDAGASFAPASSPTFWAAVSRVVVTLKNKVDANMRSPENLLRHQTFSSATTAEQRSNEHTSKHHHRTCDMTIWKIKMIFFCYWFLRHGTLPVWVWSARLGRLELLSLRHGSLQARKHSFECVPQRSFHALFPSSSIHVRNGPRGGAQAYKLGSC